LVRHNELRSSLRVLSRNQDKGVRWLPVTIKVNVDQARAPRAVVFSVQLSVVFLEIRQTDQVGAGIFF